MQINEIYELYRNSSGVCTDTRNIVEGSIFFALKGANFNGNDFALKAIEAGCSYAVCDEQRDFNGNARIILVDNALETLQHLGTFHRRQFDIPVFALTGSNGKTTTKELIVAALSGKYKVHHTKGNLNNHIGVPLTLLAMPDDAEIAVIEMGANRPNDIGELCEIALPDYGMITNIGLAHLEGFGGREGVKKAKGQMYDFIRKSGGKIFLHASDPVLKAMSVGIPSIDYSSDDTEAPVKGGLCAKSLLVQFYWEDRNHIRHEVETRLTGSYNLPNLLAAACIAQYFEVDSKTICDQLAGYTPSNNRSQVSRSNRNTLIMDAYNANPSSTESAIRDFASLDSNEARLAILGDMLELGDETQSAHSAIIHLLKKSGVDAILIGAAYCTANEEVDGGFPSFPNTTKAAAYLENQPPSGKLILLKGSRGLQLEKLIPLL